MKTRKGNFSWKIYWSETGEIQIKPNYAYPHTALAGAKAFVKDTLRYRERNDLETIRVEVTEGTAEDAQYDRGIVMKYYIGTCKDFLRRQQLGGKQWPRPSSK